MNVEETVKIAYRPERYLSFPDIVRLPSGKLLCGYRDADIHYPPAPAETFIYLVESDDQGRSWKNERIFPCCLENRETSSWFTPKLKILGDGRLLLISDVLVEGTSPELSIQFALSSDEGASWTQAIDTKIHAILPDKVVESPDGSLQFTAHHAVVDPRRHWVAKLYTSDSSLTSWQERSLIAGIVEADFCEGSIVQQDINSPNLICYLREEGWIRAPTFVCFSDDYGVSWSKPVFHPTHGHRPSAGLLNDGRMLITYREIGGTPGLHTWLGSPTATGFHAALRDLSGSAFTLQEDGLHLRCSPEPWDAGDCVGPPFFSWDAEVEVKVSMKRIEGKALHCAIGCGGVLLIQPDGIEFIHQRTGKGGKLEQTIAADFDTTTFRQYTIRLSERNISVSVDAEDVGEFQVGEQPLGTQRRIYFGNGSFDPPLSVEYPHNEGHSVWKSFDVKVKDPALGSYSYSWDHRTNTLPNESTIGISAQIDFETSGIMWESGYSSWCQLDQETVFVVDYRRGAGHRNPYIVGHRLKIPAP